MCGSEGCKQDFLKKLSDKHKKEEKQKQAGKSWSEKIRGKKHTPNPYIQTLLQKNSFTPLSAWERVKLKYNSYAWSQTIGLILFTGFTFAAALYSLPFTFPAAMLGITLTLTIKLLIATTIATAYFINSIRNHPNDHTHNRRLAYTRDETNSTIAKWEQELIEFAGKSFCTNLPGSTFDKKDKTLVVHDGKGGKKTYGYRINGRTLTLKDTEKNETLTFQRKTNTHTKAENYTLSRETIKNKKPATTEKAQPRKEVIEQFIKMIAQKAKSGAYITLRNVKGLTEKNKQTWIDVCKAHNKVNKNKIASLTFDGKELLTEKKEKRETTPDEPQKLNKKLSIFVDKKENQVITPDPDDTPRGPDSSSDEEENKNKLSTIFEKPPSGLS